MPKLTHSLALRTTLLALLVLLFSDRPTAAASIPFGNQTIIATAADGAISVRTADLDGDGDLDVLSASALGNEIAWYENDGNQNFTPHAIATIVPPDANGATSVIAADLDTDGDLDVLSSSFNDNKIAWYENTNGAGNFGPQQLISNTALGATAVIALDLDTDGDLDVLSASFNDSKIAWYENNGSQSFTPHTISTAATGATSVFAIDFDTDGDIDVLSASVTNNLVAWYENDGNQNFSPHTISNAALSAISVFATDLDTDGDLDVLSASQDDDKIAWYENNGSQSFIAHTISTAADSPTSVYAADLDTDGDLDVLSASRDDNKIAWYENKTSTRNAHYAFQNVISTAADGANSVYAADLDTDGDLDVLSASQDDTKIAWYENTNGAGSFGPQQVISNTISIAISVHTADLDTDGDLDVLSASFGDDKIAWYENDGNQSFSSHIISTAANGAAAVFTIDLDTDGDIDVLSASQNDNKIAWYENDGNQNFTPHTISTAATGANSVYATDLDRDGDIDVLSATFTAGSIAWYENNGNQSFTPHTISSAASLATSVFAIDLDTDGDIDVLSASSQATSEIAWYENDGSQNFTPHPISTLNSFGAWSVYAADLDTDGDIDVLSATFNSDRIAWYENDGNQNFTTHTVSTAADGATSVYAADLDRDGRLDLLSSSLNDDKIAWYPSLRLIRLPLLVKRPPTDLSVTNVTGGSLTFTVLGTGISCQVPNNTTQFCGSFPAGTYTVQATAICGTSFATIFYSPGPQTTTVSC